MPSSTAQGFPDNSPDVLPSPPSPRRRWLSPRLDLLPPLTALTLDSIQGDGSTLGGTVF